VHHLHHEALRRPVESALIASVAVVDQLDVGARAASVERHPERVEDEIGAHVAGALPADDHPAVGVEVRRQR
jgi:hypothetical protein